MNVPSLSEYKRALRIVLNDSPVKHVAMLRAHVAAPAHQITASELARAAGYSGYGNANLEYGKFAHRICDELSWEPPIGKSGDPTYTYVLASSRNLPNSDLLWTLREVVVEAMAALESDDTPPVQDDAGPVYADEVPAGPTYLEGAIVSKLVNARERNSDARAACLDYWGTTCWVCAVDFSTIYGVPPSRFIHVHHLQPLSSLSKSTATDPKTDLRPVCPNCHTVLHTTTPPMSIDVLRARMRQLRGAG
jgi:5-methylcytosine-specific restriction protein A